MHILRVPGEAAISGSAKGGPGSRESSHLPCYARKPRLGPRFLFSAHQTFTQLASHPKIGRQLRLTSPDLGSVRIFAVSGFPKMLVLYRPVENGVEILRVIHGARNIPV